MRRGLTFLAVALLTALALIVPERLSSIHDQQLLNSLSIQVQEEEQEGFAESIQLSVAEKVLLLHSGNMTAMTLDTGQVQGAYPVLPEDAGVEFFVHSGVEVEGNPALKAASEADINTYVEEVSQLWRDRLEEVLIELRSLQAAGGLPELWEEDSEVFYTGRGDLLYMDPDTMMSFQVYRMILECGGYTMELTADVQTGRILCFILRWDRSVSPGWGLRGASNFGGVWRNYWGLDSVSSGWYNEYNKSILEQTEDSYRINGDYNAHGQIAFTYDGQSLPIPLECEAYSGRSFSISWNL